MQRDSDLDRTVGRAQVFATAFVVTPLLLIASGAFGWWAFPLNFVAAPAAAIVVGLAMRALVSGAGRLVLRLTGASGAGDEHAPGWSDVEALVARGRVHEAAAAWRRALAAAPHDLGLHRRLADLYAGPLADPRRAATHFDAVRRLAAPVRGRPSDAARYALQRLVDLYAGPLDDRPRALACLDQLAHRFADTADGRGAAALAAEWRAAGITARPLPDDGTRGAA